MPSERRKETRRETPIAERTLPHNLDAERAVLGAIMLNNAAYEVASPIVSASDFYRDGHRRVFAAFDRLLEWKDGTVDLLTLREELAKRGELEEAGGAVYLSALIDGVPRSTNIEHYARIVFEKAQLRRLIFAMNRVQASAYEGEEAPAVILAQADKAILEIQSGNGSSRTIVLRDTTNALLQNLEHRHKHKGELSGVDTGFKSINEVTLGWQPGELIVIGARPSIGKTTFVMNSVAASAQAGRRPAVFSLEMRRQQLEYRLLSSLSDVPLSRILSGHLIPSDWEKVSKALGIMGEMQIYINDQAGLTIGDVRSECRRLRAEDGVDLIVVDYVQLMAGMLDGKATRNEQITDTSRRAKTLADELGVPVILLSQLSRANEKRNDPRPKLSDLRESGALEQDADIVGFLHRKNHRVGGLTYFIIEKQRNGPTGTLKLSLDRDVVTFTDAPNLEETAGSGGQDQGAEKSRYGD